MMAARITGRFIRTPSYHHVNEHRPDLVVSVDDSRRHRVRAVHVREEAGEVAASARGPRTDRLSVLHADSDVDGRRRRGYRRGAVACRADGLLIRGLNPQ